MKTEADIVSQFSPEERRIWYAQGGHSIRSAPPPLEWHQPKLFFKPPPRKKEKPPCSKRKTST